jgi:hypothetical protein
VGFYNGEGAGASIPNHFHYQLLPRPADYGPFPLELAAIEERPYGCVVEDAYPLDFAHWRGGIDEIIDAAMPWLQTWCRGASDNLTANVIAASGAGGETLDLYFVPRDKHRPGSAEMTGQVGGLEVLGEVIFSSEEEGQRLENGDIEYTTIKRILASVAVPI